MYRKHDSALNSQIARVYRSNFVGSTRRLRQLLGDPHLATLYRWTEGTSPRRQTLVRMCRLIIWGADEWPDDVRVLWNEKRISPTSEVRDPFVLSERIRFGFGGRRDTGALIRDSMTRMGIEHKSHLGRLMGLPDHARYKYIWRWYNGVRCTETFMVRVLALLLFDWRGYPVEDMWSIDWQAKNVEWRWDGLAGAPKPLPGNPFEWLALAPAKKGVRPRRSLRVAPYPVSMVA